MRAPVSDPAQFARQARAGEASGVIRGSEGGRGPEPLDGPENSNELPVASPVATNLVGTNCRGANRLRCGCDAPETLPRTAKLLVQSSG